MIPRLRGNGRGVAGLAAYTLHDKPVVVDGETDHERPARVARRRVRERT